MGRRLPARHFGGELPGVAPWLAAAVLATRTERLRLGVLMTLLSRRRPWTVARQAATIDRLSGDRMIAGFGLYLMTKHQTTGDYLSPADIEEAANYRRLHGAREGFDLAFNPPPDVGGEAVSSYASAGATWWIQFEESGPDGYLRRIEAGPPVP